MSQPTVTLITPHSDGTARAFGPLGFVRNLWRHRELIAQFARREIEGRYRGSFLGVFWSLARPLFLLMVYTLVFGVIFRSTWPQGRGGAGEFALIAFCGLAAFGLFAECVGRAPSLVTSVPSFVKKVVFPLEILPLAALGAALFHLLVSLALLLAAQLVLVGWIPWTALLLPLVTLPAVFVCLGAMWFLSSVGVFVRDLEQAIGLGVQLLFFLTPIVYPVEIVPERLRPLLLLNPMASVVENTRRVLLWGQLPDFAALAAWVGVTAIFMVLGYAWFVRTRRAFADVL
jgi:lipopolysaccharide transport system permease protein